MKLVSAVYDDFHPFYELLPGTVQEKLNNLIVSNDPLVLDKESILILWGGGDISPMLYKKQLSTRGYGSEAPSHRDRVEWDMLQQAIKLEIPIIGVCRGAQMLCAAAGGYLIQHLDNHAGYGHEIQTIDGETLKVNSLHHQLMYPFEVDHKLLAWSKENLSNQYWDEDRVLTEIKCEPELVVFPKIRGIAAQWHPEAMSEESPASQYLLNVIKGVINDEVHS
jgi:gamma-glutamyl-gamma-aminobutyrate hydrolase PuuD